MSIFDEQKPTAIFELGIDETAKSYLLETARWTKFLAIIGFISLGFLLIGAICFILFKSALAPVYDAASGGNGTVYVGVMSFIFLLLAGLYFYPTYALFKFSRGIKTGLQTGDQNIFRAALRYQRNMFKYIGILLVILLAFYGIAIIITVTSTMFR